MRENETEAGKVWWVQWVRPDGPDDVGGPVGRRWGRTLTVTICGAVRLDAGVAKKTYGWGPDVCA